jgi:hypothetical protein
MPPLFRCLRGFQDFLNEFTIVLLVLTDDDFDLVFLLLCGGGILSATTPEADANTLVDSLLGLNVKLLNGLGHWADAVPQHASLPPPVERNQDDNDGEAQDNGLHDEDSYDLMNIIHG